MQKNWFGLEPHPTDEYVTLRSRPRVDAFDLARLDAVHLRELFDSIPEDHHPAVLDLMGLAREHGAHNDDDD